jgi:MEMO1 family protein
MWHRKPVVAGSFYPSNPNELKKDIDGYIKKAEKKKLDGVLLGLISPHAGYVYSGPVAAYSYKQLIGSGVELVVVLAPSHRARFGGASVIDSGIYETPLGQLDIDEKIGKALINESHFTFIKEVHSVEHSLEVQVPFLQQVLGNFKIVPIVIGAYDIDSCKAIAGGLFNCLKDEKRKFVIIISTDLSHYHPYDSAVKIDRLFIDALKSADEEKVDNVLTSNKAEACGHGPVLSGLVLCKKLGASKVEILHYANSGDTAGGKGEVVGYLSAAIVK